MPAEAKPRKPRLNQECRNALAAGMRSSFRKHNQHARGATVGHPGLRSRKFVAISIEHRPRLNPCGIRSRGRLRQAKRAERLSCGQWPQIFFLLRFRTKQDQRRLHRRIGHPQRRGHSGEHSSHFFQHHHIRNGIEPRPAPFFRHQHPATPHLAKFLDGLDRKFFRFLHFLDKRTHLRLHELPDRIQYQFVVVAKRKIHRVRRPLCSRAEKRTRAYKRC